MTDFDGTAYRAIDSDAVGDDKPLDAFAHHTIANNNDRVARIGDRATVAYRVGENTVRPFTSVAPSCVAVFPILVDGTTAEVRMDVFAEIDGPRDPVMDLTLEVRTPEGNFSRSSQFSSLPDDDAKPWRVSVDLDVDDKQQATALLWVQASGAFEPGNTTNVDAFVSGNVLEVNSGGYYTDETTDPQPTTGSMEVLATGPPSVLSKGGVDLSRLMDHVRAVDGSDPTERMAMLFKDGTIGPWTGTGVDKYQLNWVQIRSIQLSKVAEPTDPQPRSQLAGGISDEESNTTLRHVEHQNREYSRSRLLEIGPRGDDPPTGEAWPTGYMKRWPTVDGDEVAPTLEQSTIYPRAELTHLRLRLLLCGVVAVDEQRGWLQQQMYERASEATWDLTLETEQHLSGTTPTSAGTSDLTVNNLVHFPATTAPRSPFLQSAHWSRFTASSGPTASDEYYWIYRDGQLFERDIDGELPILQRVSMTVPLNSSFDGSIPLRWRLVAEMDEIRHANNFFFDDYSADEWARLYLLGYSLAGERR